MGRDGLQVNTLSIYRPNHQISCHHRRHQVLVIAYDSHTLALWGSIKSGAVYGRRHQEIPQCRREIPRCCNEIPQRRREIPYRRR